MKATCISNDPKGRADHQLHRAATVEGNSPYSLTVGDVYLVVGMTIVERAFHFLVKDDDDVPFFANASLFELFTASIPDDWRFGLKAGIHASGKDLWATPTVAIWGYPELVDDPGHVQALLEYGDPAALEVFESYVAGRPWPKAISDEASLLVGFARVMEVLEDQLPSREVATINGLLAAADFPEALISLCVQLEINEVRVEKRPLSMIAAIGTYLGVDPGFWDSFKP